MPLLNIKDMKVVSPSPDNFILDLEITNEIGEDAHHYKYIASGEHIYQNKNGTIDGDLLDNHLAHSSIFKINDETIITAFSLFDMNDMAITTSYDGENQIDNILTIPNANDEPKERKNKPIEMHAINCNAIYGYIPTEKNASFGYPVYDKLKKKFIMSTHNANSSLPDEGHYDELGKTDTLTLYHYRKNATNISGVLGLGHQGDIDQTENGFDKMFVFDPTDDNIDGFETSDIPDWRNGNQSNDPDNRQRGITNNFDDGMLLARSILFPKQTLNNEYSTEREYYKLGESSDIKRAPFHYARSYNWDKNHFYSNGTHIVLNHTDTKTIDFNQIPQINHSDRVGGTMVTSTYSKRFTEASPIYHKTPEPPVPSSYVLKKEDGSSYTPKTDYNTYGTITFSESNISADNGMFNQYSPELINRENETQSDTTLMTSKHKTNIFDIDMKSLWDGISNDFSKFSDNNEGYSEIKNNLKSMIKSNLFKLVEEIKPVHTKLYKISMGAN